MATTASATPQQASQQQQIAQEQFSTAQTRIATTSTFALSSPGGPNGSASPSPNPPGTVQGINTDIHALYLNQSCLELMLIELVPTSERVIRIAGGTDGEVGEDQGEDQGDARQRVEYKHIEGIGYRVGQGLVERFAQDRPLYTEVLEVVKYICKDLWQLLFKKQIDNLKTNHRGMYVLTDNAFRMLMRMSTDIGGVDTAKRAQPYLWYSCGVIRGALANLGVQATVVADTTSIPVATFHVQILRHE
ncbi:transport protein particle component-domain-containing protein [Lipomyces oligophaga]|uniref:transport protein particle component-domain-containing protein n=1 Tax=Lipomyces oligophaga TaxID=45792 RepID=UPI0034CED906